MKKVIISTLLIIGLAAGFAYAHKSGHGYGMGGYGGHMVTHGMMGGGYGSCPAMSGHGQKWDGEAKQKYLDDTAELRREMHNKRFDYREAYRDPNTTRGELAEIEKEIWDIHAELQEKAKQMF